MTDKSEASQSGPLTGLTIVDLTTGMHGNLAAMMLSDYGANVIKVEPPGGDPGRRTPAWSVWNRGKKGVVIDLQEPQGQRQLADLAASADVIIENLEPTVARALGLNSSYLVDNPRLIVCSLSGSDTRGRGTDVEGYDSLVAARLGLMDDQPGHRSGPIYLGFPAVSYGCALLSVVGVTAALHARETTGRGQHVDLSLYDAALALNIMTWWWSERGISTISSGTVGQRFGNHRLLLRMFECLDGKYIQVHTGARGAFTRAIEVFGLSDRVKPPLGQVELAEPLTDQEAAFVWEELPHLFRLRTRDEWLELLWANEIAAQPVLQPGEAFDDPQVLFNGLVLEIDDPVHGVVKQISSPARFSASPIFNPGPAPTLGEHSEEVITLSGQRSKAGSVAKVAALTSPLAGVRVLEMGTYVAAPFAARLLADLGAEVIKIEGLDGEPMRPLAEAFEGTSRGKRSLAIDLKQEAGIALFHRIAQQADVVIHNMRPGVAERLGIDATTLRRKDPRLIYCYCPGFGSEGPKAQMQSFAPLLSGLAGLEYAAAGAENPPIGAFGNEDYFSGMIATGAVIMALIARAIAGQGQYIEVPQLNAALFTSSDVMIGQGGEVIRSFELDKDQTGFGPLDRLYRNADGWICISCVDAAAFFALADALDLDGVATDDRFRDESARSQHADELTALLEERFLKEDTAEWVERLTAATVPFEVAAARPLADSFFFDQDEVDLGRVLEQEHPVWGRIREISQFMRFSETPGCNRGPARLLGQDTREILGETGYTDHEIDDLIAQRVVGCTDVESA